MNIKKTYFFIYLALAYLCLFGQIDQNNRLELVTKSREWIQDSRIVADIVQLEAGEQPYIAIEDFIVFIKSAYLEGAIDYDDNIDSYQILTKRANIRLFLSEKQIIYNRQLHPVKFAPLVLKKGSFYISSETIQTIGKLSEDFQAQITKDKFIRKQENYITIDPSKDALNDYLVTKREIRLQENIGSIDEEPDPSIRVGLKIIIDAPEGSNRLKSKQTILQRTIEEYMKDEGIIYAFTADDPALKLAAKANNLHLDLFLYIRFTRLEQNLGKRFRLFYLTKEIHPYFAHEGNIILPYEYSSNFASHERKVERLARILERRLELTSPVKKVPAALSMVTLNEYLTMPSIIMEFYNLNIKSDQDYYSQDKNIREIGRIISRSIKEYHKNEQ